MLKRILFAVAPIVMVFGTVSADDDLLKSLATLDADSVVANEMMTDNTPQDEDLLGQADVDALLGDDEQDEDAVAACFRRIGYGYGYGYRHYGYSYSYRCYRPVYSYSYYRPVSYSYYHPVTYHVPVYNRYWACY